jgi:hypothetical protein
VLCFQDTLAERDEEEDDSLVFVEQADAPCGSYQERFKDSHQLVLNKATMIG